MSKEEEKNKGGAGEGGDAGAGAGGDDTEGKTDAFGSDNKPPEPPKKKEGEGGEGGKKFDAIPEDHPTIVALKNQIEDVKKEYGGNLSGQRDVIKRLEDEITLLKKGGTKKEGEEDVAVLYKPEEIKWSKDLTKEQREEMTETEIAQMDQIAEMRTKMNEMYADTQKKAKEGETKAVEDLNTTVRSAAQELATGEDGKVNTELANQIIESFKTLKFDVAGLSADDIKKRVEMAAKQVPDYKPPKEQTTVPQGGKTVKKGASESDPFGVDKIVEEATKGQDGTYSL